MITFPVSQSKRHCSSYQRSGDVYIASLYQQGRRFCCLDEMYAVLGAKTSAERNGIQYSVMKAKIHGLLSSTKEKGFYKVNQL